MKDHPTAAMAALAVCMAVACLAGCDDDSDLSGDSFYINPRSLTLYKGTTSAEIEAIGGDGPYRWSVSDSALGTITGDTRRVAYVRGTKDGQNVVTVEDSRTWSARATITQVATENEGPLWVAPTDYTLASGADKVTFRGSGGVRPYRWWTDRKELGNISITPDSIECTYTRIQGAVGTVVLSLSDLAGAHVYATIYQPATNQAAGGALTVTPSSAQVTKDGQMIELHALGGTPPYFWDVTDVSAGSIYAKSGTQNEYAIYRDEPSDGRLTDNVVVLEDSAGTRIFCLITE